MLMKILHYETNAVLYEAEAKSMAELIRKAIDSGANLVGANLDDASINDANLRSARSIRPSCCRHRGSH